MRDAAYGQKFSLSLTVYLVDYSRHKLVYLAFMITGFVYYNTADQEDSSGNSNLDCQPIVDERCPLGQVRLASSRKCVDPVTYDCTPACGSAGGSLDPNDGK